jgi:hypothetical protein
MLYKKIEIWGNKRREASGCRQLVRVKQNLQQLRRKRPINLRNYALNYAQQVTYGKDNYLKLP